MFTVRQIAGWSSTLMVATVLAVVDVKHGAPANDDVVKRIKKHLPAKPIIVEAGAYDGADTIELSRLLPKAKIFSFEPIPELFAKASLAVKNHKKVHLYNYALSDRTGKAVIHTSEERQNPGIVSMSSSLLEPKEHLEYSHDTLFNKDIEVDTINLDEWAISVNLPRIDFLKLDIQGYELNVIKAAPKIFSTVKALLLEVEFVEAYKGQYLYQDIKNWLEAQGFELNCLYVNSWFGDALFIRK